MNGPTLLAALALAHPAGALLPDDVSDALDAAYRLKREHRSEEAARAFESVAHDHADSPRAGEALTEAGVAWFSVGRDKQVLHRAGAGSDEAFLEAERCFRSVLEARPDDPSAGRAQYMLGSTSLFLGDLAAAEAGYGAVLERFPGDAKYVPKALARRAAVRRHLLQDDLALEDLRRYLKEFPGGEDAESVATFVERAAHNGKPAPSLDARVWVQGGPNPIEDLRGKVVALYFFATWCEKCRVETPFVHDVAKRHADAGLVVIGVLDSSRGQTEDGVRKFLTEGGLVFPAMMDGGRTRTAYGNTNVPDLVLVDKSGRIRWHDHPANLAEYTLVTLLSE